MKHTMTSSTGEVWEYNVDSPYKKCEVCGQPYLSYGRPCDHVDRRPGISPMPFWIDNPAEWRDLCSRYGYVSRYGFAPLNNGDGTYRCESVV